MNLVIDQGNTFNKIGIFDKNVLIFSNSSKTIDKEIFINFNNIQLINRVIISSVQSNKINSNDIISNLGLNLNTDVLFLDHNTKIPIGNDYKTPETLGKDRIAALVGASIIFNGLPKLVIDAGTAITIDFLDENNCFKGGNISPGINTRFKSLHQNTKKLPKLEINDNIDFLGLTTNDAICAGVQNGVLFEIKHYMDHFTTQNPNIKIVLTGGDSVFFAKKLKNAIFVDLNLVLRGLNYILEYNKVEF